MEIFQKTQPRSASRAATAAGPPPMLSASLVHDSATHEVNSRLAVDLAGELHLTAAHLETFASGLEEELVRTRLERARSVALQLSDIEESGGLIGKAANDIALVDASLKRVDELCASEPAIDLDEVKRVANARANIATVLEQLDLYSRVPSHVKSLSASLASEPRGANLRRIFREWLGLSVWRDRVLGHVEDLAQRAAKQETRNKRRERGEVSDSPDDAGVLALRVHEGQVATLKDHFRDIYLLGDAIFDIVLEIAANLISIARAAPHDVVCAAEVCERADLHAAKERALRGMSSESQRKSAFLNRMGETADSRAQAVLKTGKPVTAEDCGVLLSDLMAVHEHVARCLPKSYEPLRVYRKWYEARLMVALSAALKQVDDVERSLPLVAWIQAYNACMGSIQDAHVGLDRLASEAMDKIISTWLDTDCKQALATSSKVVELADGKLITRVPDSLDRAIKSFIGKCLAHEVTGVLLLKVFAASLAHASDWRLHVANGFTTSEAPSPERLSAHANDCERVQDTISDVFAQVARSIDHAASLAQASELVDRVCMGLSSDAEGAIARIVQGGIVRDVNEHICPLLGSPEWEESTSNPATQLVATLEDWFDHPEAGLSRWLQGNAFFLGMALNAAYRQVILCYLDSLLAWPCHFASVTRAAGRVREDNRLLTGFYSRRRKAVGYAAADEAPQWSEVLEGVADVLAGDNAGCKVLARAFGAHGLPPVLGRLWVLRGSSSFKDSPPPFLLADAPEGYGFCNMHFGWVSGLSSELFAHGDIPKHRDVVEVALPRLGNEVVVVVERETLLGRLIRKT